MDLGILFLNLPFLSYEIWTAKLELLTWKVLIMYFYVLKILFIIYDDVQIFVFCSVLAFKVLILKWKHLFSNTECLLHVLACDKFFLGTTEIAFFQRTKNTNTNNKIKDNDFRGCISHYDY